MNTGLAIFFGYIVLYAALASWLGRRSITMPMLFMAVGALSGAHVLGLLPFSITTKNVETLTEVTLALLLFADASTLDLHLLHAERRDEIDAHVKQLAAVAARALPSAPAAAESTRASDGAFATEEGS